MDMEQFAKDNGLTLNEAYKQQNELDKPVKTVKVESAGGEEVGKKRGQPKKLT